MGRTTDAEVAGLRDAPTPARTDAAGQPRPAGEAGLRARQLAEHVRYREVVETTVKIAAASDAWTRAVPGLKAEWAAHKERYPGREGVAATTQPDGSWVGDRGLRLSPEQNAEATKFAADLRDEARQTLRPAMDRVAAAVPDRKLAGLEHMLKGEDRLKEKIADTLRAQPELTVRQAAGTVPDAVRFTLCYPSERYADEVIADVGRLEREGFELVKLKNLWHSDQYKGINSQWRAPDTETRVEMQFHTPESLAAKEMTHEAYERIRSRTADSAERPELQSFQRRANSLLATPLGTDGIEDFPRTKEQNDV